MKGRATVAVPRSRSSIVLIDTKSKLETGEFDPAITRTLEEDEMDEKYGLPDTWARHMQKRTKQDNCQVCETPFSMVSLFGIGNRDFFCKHCGFAVCNSCSLNKKYLSKDAKEKYRVCDLCDTKLDNIKLKLLFERL